MSGDGSQGTVKWRHDPELREAKRALEEHVRLHRAARNAGDTAAAQREVVEIERHLERLGAASYYDLEP